MKHMKKITAIIILLLSAVFLLRTPVLAASHPSFQHPASAVIHTAEDHDSADEPETYDGIVPGINHEIVYYNEGFFGYGEKGDFKQWSIAHILPVLLMIAAVFGIYRYREKIRNWKHEETLRFLYVFVMMLFEMSYFWRLIYVGPGSVNSHTMMSKLPFQVCQWTLIAVCFMMMKKSKNLFSMTFFLTMSFGLLPLFLPAVISNTGPGYFRYYQFWAEHLMPITGVYYMMFVHEMEVKPIGMIFASMMIAVMLPPALYFNARFKAATFFYLKPEYFEMLSFLPKSLPVLMILGTTIILILFFIAYAIYRKANGRKVF